MILIKFDTDIVFICTFIMYKFRCSVVTYITHYLMDKYTFFCLSKWRFPVVQMSFICEVVSLSIYTWYILTFFNFLDSNWLFVSLIIFNAIACWSTLHHHYCSLLFYTSSQGLVIFSTLIPAPWKISCNIRITINFILPLHSSMKRALVKKMSQRFGQHQH